MNGAGLIHLKQLRQVLIDGNICIKGTYNSRASVEWMIKVVTEKCDIVKYPISDEVLPNNMCGQMNDTAIALDNIQKKQEEHTRILTKFISNVGARIAVDEKWKKELDQTQKANQKLQSKLEDALKSLETQKQENRNLDFNYKSLKSKCEVCQGVNKI